jgi:hypothetical protein
VYLLTFVFCLFAVRYGYRPWAAAAPSVQPWLSKYLAKAAAHPDTDSSSSSSNGRFSKPSWSSAGSGANEDQLNEDDDTLSADEAASDEAYPQTRGSTASQSAAAAGGAGASEPLLLHCREVVLLRPRKAPVRVVAPLPRSMRDLLHAMDWR